MANEQLATESENPLACLTLDELMDLMTRESGSVKVLTGEWCATEEEIRPAWLSAIMPSLREVIRVGREIERRYREMPIGIEADDAGGIR
jgi:hypothetical protein